MSLTEKAYAKINLYLDIISKREDGFHDLSTLMQLVTLSDDVILNLIPEKVIKITMENCPIEIPYEKNLAYIAAQKFYANLNNNPNTGVEIKIIKRIPTIGGLAGGSADAAAVLRGLNKLYNNPYTINQLCTIGEEMGSDIPFNIVGGTQYCTGRGTNTMQTFGIQHYSILIACGEGKTSTADQYKKLDEMFNNFEEYKIRDDFQQTLISYSSGDCRTAFQNMYNIFEHLFKDNEIYNKTKRIMYENKANVAMLSGSGPSIFGVFQNSSFAENAQQALLKEGIKSYICSPINVKYADLVP